MSVIMNDDAKKYRDKAAQLRAAADKYEAMARLADELSHGIDQILSDSTNSDRQQKNTPANQNQPTGISIRDRIIEKLQNGPLTRTEIVNSGIPMGSLSAVLKIGQDFQKTEDGKWTLSKAVKGGLFDQEGP